MKELKTRQEIATLLESYLKGGQSQKDFCKEHGLKYGTFQFWKKRHRVELSKSAQPGFVKIATLPTGSHQRLSPYRIELLKGSLHISSGFSVGEVKSLVELLSC